MRRFWISLLAIGWTVLAIAAQAQEQRSAVALTDDTAEWRTQIRRLLSAGRSHALVLGISEFNPRQGWRPLRGTAQEAAMVADALREHGFIVEATKADGSYSKTQLKAAIESFLARFGGDARNRLVIYIATHGYADQGRFKDDGFLIASDSLSPDDPAFRDHAFSVKELSAALSGIEAQHVFLFFNSCFSGAMLPEPQPSRNYSPAKAAKALDAQTLNWTLDLLSHNARLVLTAGNARQTVPDVDNPYARAMVAALSGDADADGDGLILGSEIAGYVRGRVARETRVGGNARENDPVFAVLPKLVAPTDPRPDAPPHVDYGLQGDFVFLSPRGPTDSAVEGVSEQAAIRAARQKALPKGQFTECADCPVMVPLPGDGDTVALARSETTYAEWDACYRELGCHRWIDDGGTGRGDRPAAGLTWQDAHEYATWLSTKAADQCHSYRLPAPDEWRRAALAGNAGQIPFAVAFADATANCATCDTDYGVAEPTAHMPANPSGYHDLIGNLWEWVEEPQARCALDELRAVGACPTDGMVMGGSYATHINPGGDIPQGRLPRTGNAAPFTWPTVGVRVACERKP